MYKTVVSIVSFFITFSTVASAACVNGQTRCTSATTWTECSNNVLYTHPVPAGTRCNDSSGSVKFVTDQSSCVNGEQRCVSAGQTTAWRECSNNVFYNHNCAAGTVCTQASSIRVTCVNKSSSSTCVENSSKCISATTWAQCSNNVFYNQPCPKGTTCATRNGSAKCI